MLYYEVDIRGYTLIALSLSATIIETGLARVITFIYGHRWNANNRSTV